MTSPLHSKLLTCILVVLQLIHKTKPNVNDINTSNEVIHPFGTRLSSRNRIASKSLGNFHIRSYPKPEMKPITLAVRRTVHPIQYVDFSSHYNEYKRTPHKPAVFEVEATNTERPPIVFNFRTLSRDVKLSQSYLPSLIPPVRHSKSEDGPKIIVKEVNIPVIHEVYEYVIPKRYYLREIKPVIEIQNQMIAQGSAPIDIKDIGNTLKEERTECFNPSLIYDKHLYSGQTPYDYKYNSTRSLMSYYNSDNMLFNVLRKYKD